MDWVGFPRSSSPAWYDELTTILRSHGLDLGPAAPEGQELIAEVELAAVGAGHAFALAPPHWEGVAAPGPYPIGCVLPDDDRLATTAAADLDLCRW